MCSLAISSMFPVKSESISCSVMSDSGILQARILEWAQFSSVQSLSHVQLFATPWTAARQASLSITNSQSLLKLMFIESVITSSHLILCHNLLLPPSIFPRIRVFSNDSVLPIGWPKYWSFSFSISPSSEYSWLISFRIDWSDFLALQGTLKMQFSRLHYHHVEMLCGHHSEFGFNHRLL